MSGNGEAAKQMGLGKPSLWREIKRNWVAYAYISPFYILFALFGAFPIIFSLFLSFQRWDGISPMKFVGLLNYTRIFNDAVFLKALSNTLIIGVVAHVPMLSLALILAFIINSGLIKYKDVFRAIYFLPMVTSSVAVSLVFMTMYGVRFGFINFLLAKLGLQPIDWWGGTGFWVKPAIIILFVWRWLGWNMVIYLAGLQGIPEELYEAARVDGANLRQIFMHITLPLLKPIILFTLILSTIGALTIFDEPYILVGSSGGTGRAGLTLAVHLYQQGFEYVHFGYASAIAYVVCIMIIVLSVLNIKIFGKPPGA
ncbi:MAG: carbohydrate ABC transporter permease [bacterium]